MPLFTIANTTTMRVFLIIVVVLQLLRAISSSPFTSTSTKPQNQDIAKTILNGLLNQLVDKTMVAVIK